MGYHREGFLDGAFAVCGSNSVSMGRMPVKTFGTVYLAAVKSLWKVFSAVAADGWIGMVVWLRESF